MQWKDQPSECFALGIHIPEKKKVYRKKDYFEMDMPSGEVESIIFIRCKLGEL